MVNTNKLYIGNLSHDVTEENLRQFFEACGVASGQMVRLLVKKGFAFLECSDQAAADVAIDRCHGQPLLGTIVTVEPSLASKASRLESKTTISRVVVSNCGDTVSTQELESYLTSYGGSILATERSRRGSFIVTFPTVRQADLVVLQCNGSNIQGNIIKVEKCNPMSFGVGDDRNVNRFRNLSESRGVITGGPRGDAETRDIYNSQSRTYYQSRTEDIPLKILVPSECIGALIGKGGQTIKGISLETGARLDVFRNVSRWEMAEKPVTIYGPPEKATQACKKVLEIMAKETTGTVPKNVDVCLRMLAYNNLVGRVIGKGGSIIKKIMEDTQTKIHISNQPEYIGTTMFDCPQERVITIRGSIEGMSNAEANISEKIRVAYSNDFNSSVNENFFQPTNASDSYIAPTSRTSLPFATANDSQTSFYSCASGRSYGQIQSPGESLSGRIPNFNGINLSYHHPETTYMYIPNESVGAVIGRKGANIRRIIHESGASVKVLEFTADMNEIMMRRISIHGGVDSIFRAQYFIVEKVLEEGRDSIVPDSCMTVEMSVPAEHVGRLIGKSGQHIREIQRTCHCRVKFITEPDEDIPPPPVGEVFVRITGNIVAMNEAQQKIRSLLIYALSRASNANNNHVNSANTSAEKVSKDGSQ